MTITVGYNGTAKGRMHIITHQGPQVGSRNYDGHLTAACGQEFDGFVWTVSSWTTGTQPGDRCARCTMREAPKPVRITVTVPLSVDADAWELTYGTRSEDDMREHLTATVHEAVREALAAQANGATVR